MAHQQLDVAVGAAYGWADYSANTPDNDILKRLLALNLARSAPISGRTDVLKHHETIYLFGPATKRCA